MRELDDGAAEQDPMPDHIRAEHALVLAEFDGAGRGAGVRAGHERGEVHDGGGAAAEELPERGDGGAVGKDLLVGARQACERALDD